MYLNLMIFKQYSILKKILENDLFSCFVHFILGENRTLLFVHLISIPCKTIYFYVHSSVSASFFSSGSDASDSVSVERLRKVSCSLCSSPTSQAAGTQPSLTFLSSATVCTKKRSFPERSTRTGSPRPMTSSWVSLSMVFSWMW